MAWKDLSAEIAEEFGDFEVERDWRVACELERRLTRHRLLKRETDRRYRWRHRERVLARSRAYYARNREKVAAAYRARSTTGRCSARSTTGRCSPNKVRVRQAGQPCGRRTA